MIDFGDDGQGLFADELESDAAGCTYGRDDAVDAATDDIACTDASSHVQDSVRTEEALEVYEPATKRFEVRLAPSQLERWRSIAADQRCKLAELVRIAVDFAAAHMPPGYVNDSLQREGLERIQRALAGMSSREAAAPDA